MSGATFTISPTGSRGTLFDTVVVPPGQAAVVGIGPTVRRLPDRRDGRGGRPPASAPRPISPCRTTAAWWTVRSPSAT
ncbi:2-oxo acid dehydrogenase subunit E2 [Streptomyces zhihengii]